jgi:hypothetical protein
MNMHKGIQFSSSLAAGKRLPSSIREREVAEAIGSVDTASHFVQRKVFNLGNLPTCGSAAANFMSAQVRHFENA